MVPGGTRKIHPAHRGEGAGNLGTRGEARKGRRRKVKNIPWLAALRRTMISATTALPVLLHAAEVTPSPLNLNSNPVGDNEPAAELASFKVADGFEVNLFASEKEGIIKPIGHRFDRLGRLWVIGSKTYPQIKPGEEPNDYVKIL